MSHALLPHKVKKKPPHSCFPIVSTLVFLSCCECFVSAANECECECECSQRFGSSWNWMIALSWGNADKSTNKQWDSETCGTFRHLTIIETYNYSILYGERKSIADIHTHRHTHTAVYGHPLWNRHNFQLMSQFDQLDWKEREWETETRQTDQRMRQFGRTQQGVAPTHTRKHTYIYSHTRTPVVGPANCLIMFKWFEWAAFLTCRIRFWVCLCFCLYICISVGINECVCVSCR